MSTTKYPALLDVILFDGLNKDEIDSLLIDFSAKYIQYEKSDTIYSPCEKERKLGIVISGKAFVYSADVERKVLLKTLDKSQIFGISNLFSKDDTFSTYIIAKNTCKILFLSVDDVSEMLQTNKIFLHNYIEYLTNRIRFLNRRITYFTAGSAERRLGLYLCSLGEDDVVDIKCNMSELSLMLDIGRASLYRAFDTLCKDNLISRPSTEKVKILNRNQLLEKYK